ncbi:hypothetical protein GQX74_013180 [Glossina fuscipes]|nr:hypothetical protein GQX74_013180 [Glossina fuscipes]
MNTNNNFGNITVDDATGRSLLNNTGDSCKNLNCHSLYYMKIGQIKSLIISSRWEVVLVKAGGVVRFLHIPGYPGFSLCCIDTSTRKGGGVALYISNKLRFSVVDPESFKKVMQNLFVHLPHGDVY